MSNVMKIAARRQHHAHALRSFSCGRGPLPTDGAAEVGLARLPSLPRLPRLPSLRVVPLVVCLVFGLAACAGPQANGKPATSASAPAPVPPASAAPPSAAESWRSLRLRLNPPLDAADALARELTFALETTLVHAGLQLVRDPAAAVDAHLDLASAFHSVGFAIHGTAFLAVEGDGVLVDQVTTSDGFYRRDHFATEAARELVTALLASPRMATFAAQHRVIPVRMVAAGPPSITSDDGRDRAP